MINWEQLREIALQMTKMAYCKYSGYAVGAAALVDDGRIVKGCNVENAGYGVTLCAECGLISELVASGGGKLVAFCCTNRNGEYIMPCGRCRQLLSEHAATNLAIMTPKGEQTIAEVLPQAFNSQDLSRLSR